MRPKSNKICEFWNCDKPYVAGGYCKYHYDAIVRGKAKFIPKPCKTEGCNKKAYKYDICSSCRTGWESSGGIRRKIGIEEVIDYHSEIKRILILWKRGFVNELLYLRTLDLYLSIFHYNKKVETIKNPDDLMIYILKELHKELSNLPVS